MNLNTIKKYHRKGVLVDTNLLIVFVIGSLDPNHLHNCRATKAFIPEDFQLLCEFLRQFRCIITTPHVLTEVSNLAGKLPEPLHQPFRASFRKIIERMNEESEASKIISDKAEFLRFGLTDTAIATIAPGRYLVLTDEIALSGLLEKRGVDVVNFNHLRSIGWELV